MVKNLWHKNFILLLICSITFSFGTAFSGMALSFLVLKFTNSASAMSIALALWFLPSIFTPIMATWVDRMNLKTPLIASVVIKANILFCLYIVIKLGFLNPYVFYSFALFNGVISTILLPASTSLIPNVISQNQLARGNSLLAIANQTAQLIGLICGGGIVASFGPESALLLEGVCYLVVFFLLFFICMLEDSRKKTASFYDDFISGINLTITSVIIITIMIANVILNILTAPIKVLLPTHMIYIGKGAFGYGIFTAIMSSGMILGNAIIAILGSKFKAPASMIYGWFITGIALGGIGLLNSYYLSLLWAFLFGLGLAILSTGSRILLQIIVPVVFRARVLGTYNAIAQVGTPAALLVLSFIVGITTLKQIFLGCMLLAIILALIWILLVRKKLAKFAALT